MGKHKPGALKTKSERSSSAPQKNDKRTRQITMTSNNLPRRWELQSRQSIYEAARGPLRNANAGECCPISPYEEEKGRLTIIYRIEAQEGGEEPDVRKRQLVSTQVPTAKACDTGFSHGAPPQGVAPRCIAISFRPICRAWFDYGKVPNLGTTLDHEIGPGQ
jgi:hypothetical protein